MPRLANDCLSQVERGALEEQLRCDNCVLGKTEDWGPWYLKPAIRIARPPPRRTWRRCCPERRTVL
jgi:hypothetical protein